MSKKETKGKQVKAPAAPKAKKEEAPKLDGTKSFVVKKFLLLQLAEWLSTIITNPGDPQKERKTPWAMHGPKARARNHIHKMIVTRAREVEDERMEIVKSFAVKDKATGEPVLDEKTNRFTIPPKDQKKFDDEFLALMKEETAFDVLPSNIQDWRTVKDIFINEMKSEFTVDDGIVYEEMVEAFMKLKV